MSREIVGEGLLASLLLGLGPGGVVGFLARLVGLDGGDRLPRGSGMMPVGMGGQIAGQGWLASLLLGLGPGGVVGFLARLVGLDGGDRLPRGSGMMPVGMGGKIAGQIGRASCRDRVESEE